MPLRVGKDPLKTIVLPAASGKRIIENASGLIC
jgi:hypothetical protein